MNEVYLDYNGSAPLEPRDRFVEGLRTSRVVIVASLFDVVVFNLTRVDRDVEPMLQKCDY